MQRFDYDVDPGQLLSCYSVRDLTRSGKNKLKCDTASDEPIRQECSPKQHRLKPGVLGIVQAVLRFLCIPRLQDVSIHPTKAWPRTLLLRFRLCVLSLTLLQLIGRYLLRHSHELYCTVS